jgi:hypothetical protein
VELEPVSQQSLCNPIDTVWDWLINPNHNEILVGDEPSDTRDTP